MGLLEIEGRSFSLKKIPLSTVRPFSMGSIVLREHLDKPLKTEQELETFLVKKLKELIKEAKNTWKGDFPDCGDPKLPLIRLKVEYTGHSSMNPNRRKKVF